MRSRVRDNVDKTASIAMLAVAQHAVDHDLPAIARLERPKPHLGEPAVVVELYPEDVTAWLDTVVVDDEHTHGVIGTRERVSYDVRLSLPVGEIRVSLRSFRVPVPLRAVPAPTSPPVDLLGALQRSVDAAKTARGTESGEAS